MKKWRQWVTVLLGIIMLSACAACSANGGPDTQRPITISVWHVYGAQTDSPFNDIIDIFNQTVGKERGINIQVTSVSNTNTIHEAVLAAANQEPGAPGLPDLFISYPKTVLAMPDDNILVDYHDYFSEEELSVFLPSFLEEGMIDERLLVLPIAKSTEILYVNQTAFDRFAAATGARIEDMETWEGLFQLANAYAAWTDGQTAEIENDAKAFFVHDYYFNYFQVGAESLGESFFDGDHLAFGSAFKQAWTPLAEAALRGGIWLQGGYATEPLRTGDSIVSVASSASVLYYSDEVTYPDNTSEKIEITTRPCPTFREGEKLVMQRGAGFCLVKSTPEREQAAATFLKWLTEPQQNVEFVTKLGYMPVTQEAFDVYLPQALETLRDPLYVALYETFLEMQADYTFYTAPQVETYLDCETDLEQNIRLQLRLGRQAYLDGLAADEVQEELLEQLSQSCYRGFQEAMENGHIY
jgi:multiple sugar transport system substrate-binding protein